MSETLQPTPIVEGKIVKTYWSQQLIHILVFLGEDCDNEIAKIIMEEGYVDSPVNVSLKNFQVAEGNLRSFINEVLK